MHKDWKKNPLMMSICSCAKMWFSLVEGHDDVVRNVLRGRAGIFGTMEGHHLAGIITINKNIHD